VQIHGLVITALFVASFHVSLLSVPQLDDLGFRISFYNGIASIKKPHHSTIQGTLSNGLYRIPSNPILKTGGAIQQQQGLMTIRSGKQTSPPTQHITEPSNASEKSNESNDTSETTTFKRKKKKATPEAKEIRQSETISLWHQRFAYMGQKALDHILKYTSIKNCKVQG
jgi:hypothetical protein